MIGNHLSGKTLNLVARDVGRFELHDIRTVLVSTDVFSWDELTDRYQWGGLFGSELVVHAIQEKGSRELVPAFHEKGWLEPETLDALDEDGVAYEEREDTEDDDDELEPTESFKQNRLRAAEIILGLRIWLANTSRWIEETYSAHRGWFRLVSGFILLVTFLIVLARFLKDDEEVPPVTPSATPSSTLPPTETQTETAKSTQTATPSPEPSATYASTIESTPTEDVGASLDDDIPTISISEIMFVPQAPQGIAALESWNEYVELHNHGDEPVDVAGWWITDGGGIGSPDQLVAWTVRLSNIPVGTATIDSTVIPVGGYALILPTKYDEGNRPYDDLVTDGTIILTIADNPNSDSELIGDGGLKATDQPLDFLILYEGTRDKIEHARSTYGTPTWDEDGSTSSVRDNVLDLLPRAITVGWGGYRRVHLDGDDTYSNWQRFTWEDMTPGFAYTDPDSE